MRKHFLSFGIVLALIVIFFTTTAFTNALTVQAATQPHARACNEGYVYDGLTKSADSIAPVTPTFADYNGTNHVETDTFTATTSGTVTLTATAEETVSANVVLGSVAEKTGVSVSFSLTATVGNQTQLTVDRGKTGYAQYGVWRVVTTGHYYYRFSDCSIGDDQGYVTAYSPYRVGWRTWTA